MYNYEKYTAVKAEIERRRLAAEAEADSRSADLRAKSAEIAEIDRELSGTGMKLFKAALAGEDLIPLKERNQELNKKRREIIVSLGYPEDYTDVHYTCPLCRDTGYVGGNKVCSCLKEELIKATIASSGIGNLIEKQSFDNFELGIYEKDERIYKRMKNNLEVAKRFVENFRTEPGNLLFVGKTGTGKTHLSTAIAREIIKSGFDVIYDTTQNIMSDFETDRFKNAYSQAEPLAEKYLKCDLLIMDDLGTEFATPFTVSCIYNLINTRQNRGLSTIISTNLDQQELLSRYEDRIYSRLIGSDYRVLYFVGPDRRLV
ncbi:MAG: ATP-binding protein [Clostridia bacterium]|nr:ATP-binding protein [Clostridia bacterium]